MGRAPSANWITSYCARFLRASSRTQINIDATCSLEFRGR